MSSRSKIKSRILCTLMAALMLLSVFPASVFAAPASDIPAEMLDNNYLDALAYTGFDVQRMKDEGTIFKKTGSSLGGTGILSNITYGYGCSGIETVSKSGTATGLAPDIAAFERGGLCCAAYTTYVYFNYLPNIAGVDTSQIDRPSGLMSASSWYRAAQEWISVGMARSISFTQNSNGSNFTASEEIPIGSLIVFHNIGESSDSIAHVALYAGYYGGRHWLTHVGNDHGPEFSTIDGMSKGGQPEAVTVVIAPYFVEESGKIEIYKKDTNGKNLSGACFTATKTDDSSTVFDIGPTDSNGYAATKEDVPYGTYKVVETVFPANYTASGPTSWTVTVDAAHNGVATVNAVNKLKTGKIEVHKTDPNGKNLSGAIFTVYNANGDVVTTIGPTNASGYAAKDGISYGTYRVKETTFPRNYKAHGATEWNVTLNDSNSGKIVVNAENELKKGYIEVNKSDAESGEDLSGAEFTVYDMSGNTVTVIGPTNSSGYAKSKEIYYGYYRVVETKIPEYYQLGKVKEWNVEVSDDVAGLVTLDITNDRQYGSVKVIKSAEDNFKENLIFSLKGTSVYGDYIDMTVATDVNGIALFDHVPVGTGYVLSEKNTPIRYVVPDKQNVTVEWNKVTERECDNILKKWNAEVYKLDTETLNVAQGDASMAGAVYGVYKGGQLVDTYTTDARGHFTTDYYVCDTDWTIQEIAPSEGYLLDDTVYYVGADPSKYEIELNTVEMSVFETVIEGDVAIIKHTDDGSTQIETPEEGATFEMYLKKAGSYANAKESERDILVCDENGFAQSKLVPYGVYTIHQISGWEGCEFLHDFDVFIEKDQQTYRYLINNDEFESYIKIIKTDAESGLSIPYAGAEFEIYDPDGNKVTMSYTYPTYTEVSVFRTNAEGYLITPQCLPYGSGYTLVEVTAPYSYVLDSTPISFDVKADTATEDGVLTVVVVTRPNMPQKGVIHITKTGEVFQSVAQSDNLYKPVYEVKGLAGAVYDIYAAEDIYTLDGIRHYSKGDLIDTVTTGSDGIGTSKQLYLGKYEIKESKAPNGMILNKEIQTVELVYAGQDISVTDTEAAFNNDRQHVRVSLAKQLEQNELFGIGMNEELADITFGLYAAENLIAGDGSEIPADGLIEIVTFDTDGNAVCSSDLPLGKYYLQERSTNAHYVLNTHKYDFAFTYGGQDIPTVDVLANAGEPIPNDLKYGSVSGLKIDEDGNTIEGATFGLFRNNEEEFTAENALLTAISGKDGRFTFINIPYGTWVVRELIPAEGFVLNEKSYQITIEEDKQVVEIELENRYIYSDVEGLKLDEDGKIIEGTLFGLFSDDETEFTEENALMTELTDAEGKFRFEHLRYGHYQVRELVPAEGFVLNETVHPINVCEDGAVIEIQFENRYIRGDILGKKVDEDGLPVVGAVFGLFLPDDTEFTEENAILTAVSNEEGIFRFEDIRYGSWLVRELKPAEGFVLNEKVFPVEIKSDGEVIEIEAENRHIYGGVATTKVDRDYPDHHLTGAVFEVYQDVNGNGAYDPEEDIFVVELQEVVTGIYQREQLRYGRYLLHEKTAPEGFILDEAYYPFSITHDGEIVIVENSAGVGFINQPKVGNLKIIKSSSDGKLEGFSFRIEGENYNNVFTTDVNGEIYIEGLRLGTYTVTEISDSVSAGYKRPDPVTVELAENETLTVNMYNEKETPDNPKTGDDFNMSFWIGIMLASMAGFAATIILSRFERRKVK